MWRGFSCTIGAIALNTAIFRTKTVHHRDCICSRHENPALVEMYKKRYREKLYLIETIRDAN